MLTSSTLSFLSHAIELIAVNQNAAALEALHDVIISKRSRSVPLASLEPIMLKFVELCVSLRKGKIAYEGLHQYKNISQNTSIATIEVSPLADDTARLQTRQVHRYTNRSCCLFHCLAECSW